MGIQEYYKIFYGEITNTKILIDINFTKKLDYRKVGFSGVLICDKDTIINYLTDLSLNEGGRGCCSPWKQESQVKVVKLKFFQMMMFCGF